MSSRAVSGKRTICCITFDLHTQLLIIFIQNGDIFDWNNLVKLISFPLAKMKYTKHIRNILSFFTIQVGDKEVGGGLESHPRLICGTMYRSTDNVLTMPSARDIILEVSPPNFTISLSTCYNYTNSFREKSIQSEQHHVLKDVNARISLKKPPRIGVSKFVPNLHWTTKNVNLMLEKSETERESYIIDSRDAKCIIPGNILIFI